jgi:hypothetical protein
MMRIFLVFFLVTSLGRAAIDGLYLGAQVGQVGLTGSNQNLHGNSIGAGLDLGFRTLSNVEILFQSQLSSHSSNLKLYSQTLGANLRLEIPDFEILLGLGPGFYTFSKATSNTYFGVHWDVAGDVVVTEALRLGLGFRYHSLFGETGADDYWSVMMRFGYLFELGR